MVSLPQAKHCARQKRDSRPRLERKILSVALCHSTGMAGRFIAMA
jgi:hypothetical protein